MMQSEINMYIGKNIDSIDGTVLVNEVDIPNSKTYQWDAKKEFLGIPLDFVVIRTDSSNIITNIIFSFEEGFDQNLYQLMVAKYGDPTTMFKMEIIEAGKPIEHEHFLSTRKRGIAKPCSFGENPLYIGWDKTSYKIEVEIGVDSNRTRTRIVFGSQNYILKQL
ncbi:hypothetical protein [Maribacter sp. 2307UL18-2]|uniref:hypothetical protein n=1 Tax=Maribacter sp. 2307UL18-2 TaxID=3386274 RepID=UPI0039BCC05C